MSRPEGSAGAELPCWPAVVLKSTFLRFRLVLLGFKGRLTSDIAPSENGTNQVICGRCFSGAVFRLHPWFVNTDCLFLIGM